MGNFYHFSLNIWKRKTQRKSEALATNVILVFYGVKLYSLLLLRIDRLLKENAKILFGNKFIERLIFIAFVPILCLVEIEDISLPLVFNSYISLLCRARIPFLITYGYKMRAKQ